ncbi:MAG: murein L,D-transpeptidase catalytic domain family protein [Bacteroidota bacterium]
MRYLFLGKSKYLILLVLFLAADSGFSKFDSKKKIVVANKCSLYDELNLAEIGLKESIFNKALAGWNNLVRQQHIQKANLLSIADLTQSSNSKRLYVIDMENRKVLFNTYVAHGRNSGEEYAYLFANKPESFKSSLGFYITGETYNGAHGLSMKLFGVERGINDDAEQRGIVMHGAPYVSESFIRQNGRLGRSQGCPAVPIELCNPIVNCIKSGSGFFMFYPDSNYYKSSSLL